MPSPERTPKEIIDQARLYLSALCHNPRKWRMSIPVHPDDTDRVLYGLLHLAEQQRVRIEGLEAEKNAAYTERNRVVALLATCLPAVRGRTMDAEREDDWRTVVYFAHPAIGQLSWHCHYSEAHLWEHVPPLADDGQWDGTTTEAKYAAMEAWCASGKRSWYWRST